MCEERSNIEPIGVLFFFPVYTDITSRLEEGENIMIFDDSIPYEDTEFYI